MCWAVQALVGGIPKLHGTAHPEDTAVLIVFNTATKSTADTAAILLHQTADGCVHAAATNDRNAVKAAVAHALTARDERAFSPDGRVVGGTGHD